MAAEATAIMADMDGSAFLRKRGILPRGVACHAA